MILNFFIILLQVNCYADWQQVDPLEFKIKSPPVAGSQQDLKDYKQLLVFQKERTQEQCDQAAQQWIPFYQALYQYSGVLSKEEVEQTKELMKGVFKVTEKVTDYYKKFYSKERPYDRFPDIEPCIKRIQGKTSYPSSHAALGVTVSCVLTEIYPQKTNELIDHGVWIGELRAISGVHHPSDVKAGQDLGQKICDHLKSQKDFNDEIKNLIQSL
jgi:hypothetical protein